MYRIVLLLVLLSLSIGASNARGADDSGLAAIVGLLAEIDDPSFQLDLLKGMRDGLKGRTRVPMPAGWDKLYPKLAGSESAEVREQAKLLALTFGDPAALAELRKTMLDPAAPQADREAALTGLVNREVADLAADLRKLLTDKDLRGPAISGLAAYNDEATPAAIIGVYGGLSLAEKQSAHATLASRKAYAKALLAAVAAEKIPAKDISAVTARQIKAHGDKALSEQLRDLWGELKDTPAEKKAEIARYKKLLTPKFIAKGDASNGRAVYHRTCHQCHKLFGEGGDVGPDLTGSNRANLDYVLENVITPSVAIAKDYQLREFETVNGRLISGIIRETTPSGVVVQTAENKIVISKEIIVRANILPISMMPEGQWNKLTNEEVRDLVKYLASGNQVPLPEGFDAQAE